MDYRKIGKTGMTASVIGLGLEHVDNKPYAVVKEVIDAAFEKEINFFDVFMPGDAVRENISKAIAGRRKDVLLQGHIGSVDINQQYDIARDVNVCRKYFENLLRILKTDYIDLGMMFFIDSEEDYKNVFDTDFITYVEKLKKDGTIRAIGFSSHNPVTAKKAVETGIPELMMFSINPAFDMAHASAYVLDSLEQGCLPELGRTGLDPTRQELYKFCESKGVAISVMKTFGAGKLLSDKHTPFGSALTPAQCIHYALTRPAVVSVMAGCKTKEEVYEAARYVELSNEEKDYSSALHSLKSDFSGKCVYCNHCQPCPSEIDIAAVTKYLDIALLNHREIPTTIKHHYNSLPRKASSCIACGSCEARCPFKVQIIENMREAADLLEQ